MVQTQEAHLSPETVMEEMKKNGVTHVVWLPDSETNWLYLLMQADPSLHLVAVSREGHAFATAAGLSVGGKTPIILIQNTGLMESGDSLRGWALGHEHSRRVDGGLPGLDPARRHPGHRGHLYRALHQCLRHQLLSGGKQR